MMLLRTFIALVTVSLLLWYTFGVKHYTDANPKDYDTRGFKIK